MRPENESPKKSKKEMSDDTTQKIWEDYKKEEIADEEIDAESARQERRQSLEDEWESVKAQCTDAQIKGIQWFVENGSYGVAASLAGMSVPDFIELLDDLGIARCI